MADTTAIPYIPITAITAGSADQLPAATCKLIKYENLSQRYAFVFIATKLHGTFSKSALEFFTRTGTPQNNSYIRPQRN